MESECQTGRDGERDDRIQTHEDGGTCQVREPRRQEAYAEEDEAFGHHDLQHRRSNPVLHVGVVLQ